MSPRFEQKLEEELGDLGMENTGFLLKSPIRIFGRKGMDRSNLISPNPGEELRPLARIASGGNSPGSACF
jgi:DNA repair protein RecN (Recombination protein N)